MSNGVDEARVPIGGVDTRRIWLDLLLYPGHTFPTAAAPILVASGLAAHDGVYKARIALCAFVASWAIHVGGVFLDNYALITRHADVPEHPELLAALRNGSLTRRGLRLAIIACLALSLFVAPPLANAVGWPLVLALGVVGTIASFGYAGGPLPYAKLGVADPVFFVMFGLVAVPATYLAQRGLAPGTSIAAALDAARALPRSVFIAGLPIAALVTNVLLIDEIRDADFDRAKNWRSGAVRWGRAFSRAEIWALTVLAYAIPFWLWRREHFSGVVLLPLVTLPTAFRCARRVWSARRFEELFPMTPRTSRLALIYATLLAIGLSIH